MLRKWLARILSHLFRKNTERADNPNCETENSPVLPITQTALETPEEPQVLPCSADAASPEETPHATHVPEIDAAISTTCVSPGLTEGAHCAVCGEVLRPQEEIPALGHSEVIDATVPATCTKSGWTEGAHCRICKKVLIPQAKLPMLHDLTEVDGNGAEAFLPSPRHIQMEEVPLSQGTSNAPSKRIQARAYRDRTDIGFIDLPNETTHIDEEAFAGCTSLKSIVIPESVRKIGQGAFMGCTALEKITLPSTLKEIPKSCFENCTSLHTVVTGPELRSVKMNAFHGCYSLRHLALPACCWEISPNAFMGCKGELITLHVVPGSFAEVYAGKHHLGIGAYAAIQDYYEQDPAAEENPCAAGHVEMSEPPVPATCVDAGWTAWKHCAVCGAVITPRCEIPALGHDVETLPLVPPTCTAEGKTAGTRCKRCGELLLAQETLSALGHRIEKIPGRPASETAVGLTAGARCSRCGKILTPQAEIPILTSSSPATDRLEVLTSEPAMDWPLNRILAFGVTVQEYNSIAAQFKDEYLINFDVLKSPICADGSRKWLDRLSEEAWSRAMKLCCAISQLYTEHADGLKIARQRLMGVRDRQLCLAMECSPAELQWEFNEYVHAVTNLFRHHARALDFIYPRDLFDRGIAEVFFGPAALNRIERCCDMDRIHALHGERPNKPVGLMASLKTEASNRRTRVLTDWEHLRNYIVDQFDSQPILGSIELDEKEYQMLLENLRRTYRLKMRVSSGLGVDKVVCVALVQIAVRCTGTAYWPAVANALEIEQTPEMSTALGKCFIQTMKGCKKATFATSEYVASIKLHTFVINAYIDRLFDFIYAYYELDLGRNLQFANLEELQALVISGAYFSRKQLLLQQTIDALRLIPEASLNRLKTYLSWIDSAFWQPGWLPDHEDRFSHAFQKWCAGKDEFNGRWAAGESSKGKGKRMHSRPTLCLDVRSGQLNLILPVQRLPFGCDDSAIWVISEGSGARSRVACALVESITGFRTEELTHVLSMDCLLSEISMEFCNGGKVVKNYVIPPDCVRMFNEHGQLLMEKHVPAGRVYFLTRPDTGVITESETIQHRFGPWNLQVSELQEGETVIFPDDTLAVVGRDTSEGLCSGHLIAGATVGRKGVDERYPIYEQFPYFLLKVTPAQFAKTRFQINDRYFSADEVRFRQLTLHERTQDTGYLVTLPPPHEDFQLCHVHISVPGDGHKRDWTFCCWPNFAYSFDNGKQALPYWDSPRGAVRICSSLPMRGDGVEKSPSGDGEYGFIIKAEPEPLLLDFDWQHECWTLALEVPALAWRQPESDWLMTPIGEIWHKDFPDAIDLWTQAGEITLSVDRDGLQNGQSVSFRRRKEDAYVHCDLLALRQWFTRDRIIHRVYLHADGRDFDFAAVYCRSYLVSGRLEARSASGEIRGSFEIIGKGDYSATLLYRQEELLTHVPISDGSFTAQAPLKSGLYTAILYEKAEDEFGFDTAWDEIGRKDIRLLNPGDLAGASLTAKHLDTLNEQPEELGLRADCCRIRLTERAEGEGTAYFGVLQDPSGEAPKEFSVLVSYPNPDAIDHCRIHFLEDGEWTPFLYDYSQKRIVTHENRKMPFMERYRHYVALVPEDTFTVVYDTN